MLIEELARDVATNFDKLVDRPIFSVQRRESINKQLNQTIRHVLCELSSWLIDKYSTIDIDQSSKNNVDIGLYIDIESFYHDLMLEVKLFIDTLKNQSSNIVDVKNNMDDIDLIIGKLFDGKRNI